MMARGFVLAGILLLMSGQHVWAQRGGRVPGYASGPSISPYVNLFGNNSGGTNNYFRFVRPMQRQQQFNQLQMNENRRLQQQLMGQPVRPQVGLSLLPNRGPNSGTMNSGGGGQLPLFRMGNTGVGQPSQAATYFNYSHYYNVPGQRR